MTDQQIIIRDWVRGVAYAEDDFVLEFEDGTHTGTPREVIRLLDSLDPDWRVAFDREAHPTHEFAHRVLDALDAVGIIAEYDFPGVVRFHVTPFLQVATGLNGYDYGSLSTLVDNAWEPVDHRVAEPNLVGNQTPEEIAAAWREWLDGELADLFVDLDV